MDLSIIIVNWNTREITKKCLESIFKYTEGIKFEVIVIDNASEDDSVKTIRSEFPEVIIIQNNSNRGFATANNQGMEIAKGLYFLLLNSDTLIFNNALKKVVGFADSNPSAGLIGCRVLNADKSLQPTCFMYPGPINLLFSVFYLEKLFPKSKIFAREKMTWWNRDSIRNVEVITGCCILANQDAVNSVGTMDDAFFMYGEETDWCFRFKKAGWKILFYPDAEIIHLGGQSSKKAKPVMILQLRAGILQFIKKQYTYPNYFISKLLVSLWFFIRVPFWCIHDIINNEKNFIMSKTYLKGSIRSLFGWERIAFK